MTWHVEYNTAVGRCKDIDLTIKDMPVDEQTMGEDNRRSFPTIRVRVHASVDSQGVLPPLISGVECSSQKKGIFEDLIASDPTASDLEPYRQAAATVRSVG
jgi:hypothetical protein